jgi:DNA-binding NarL/FixJ family response regulator
VIEDHLGIRRGVELLLRSEGMQIAGVASELAGARRLLARRRYDVALIDVHLGEDSALGLVEDLICADSEAAIVLYTGLLYGSTLHAAMHLGTRGFVLKASPAHRLIKALRSVARGGHYVDPYLAPMLSRDAALSRLVALSPREREILGLLAEGLSGQAIAERLLLSPETVRTHVRNATAKLGATTRVQAVAMMVRDRALQLSISSTRVGHILDPLAVSRNA